MQQLSRKFLSLTFAALMIFSMLPITLIVWSQPPMPTLSVDPPLTIGPMDTDTFSVDVTISDLVVDYRAVGIEFRLGFNDTVLEVDNVVEGPFMQNPAWNHYGTYFIYVIEAPTITDPACVLVGILLLPNGTGDWEDFPVGGGVLATVTFKWKRFGSSDLTLYGEAISNPELVRQPANLESGVAQVPLPILSVDPPLISGPMDTDTFSVDVTISDLSVPCKAVGMEFRLGFNDTVLEVDNVVAGPFMQDPEWNHYGIYFISIIEGPTLTDPAHVLVGILLLPNSTGGWEDFPYGDGVLATVTFKWKRFGSSDLPLFGGRISDPDQFVFQPATEDGYCEVPLATLSVEPSFVQAHMIDEVFSVNVTISGLSVNYQTAGIEFRLGFNSTLLEVVDVVEGPFMEDPEWNHYGTFFTYFVEGETILYPAHVLVGILLLPDGTGSWVDFPHGDGVLATITFRAIYQEATVDPESTPPTTCDLDLFNAAIGDPFLDRLPVNTEDGLYEILPRHLADINGDGYVGIDDIIICAEAFGSFPSHSRWNPNCDLNGDDYVGIDDVVIVCQNFGWPY